jgi:lysophospholipase L1-like esterase
VLTLLCGVNDMLVFGRDPENSACSQEGFAANLREMLSRTREALPETRVILGIPFFYEVTDVDDRFTAPDDLQEQRTTLRYRKVFTSGAAAKLADMAIRQETVRRAAAEYGCVLLDIPALFEKAFADAPPSYWIWDGVHPTYAMHGRIAEEWLRLWKEMDL